MIYLVVSAISLALMVAVYRLTLSRTTFHGFNRYVLLASLTLAAVIPLMHFQMIGNRAAAPVAYMLNEITVYSDGMSSVTTQNAARNDDGIGLISVITIIYLAGVIICLLRVGVGVLSSEIICRKRSRTLADGSRLVITERNYAPFSWRNCIVISRKDYEANGAMIIAHEQAHISHHHSIDLILAQIFCSVQWFNPAAWMLKRSLLEVHEFEADASVLEHGFDERRYQICLVRAALQGSFATTTNNFANCSTKKRIVMMNRHSTNPWARLRVLLMLPAVAFAIVLASACKHDATENEDLNQQDKTQSQVQDQDIVIIEMEPEDVLSDVFEIVEDQPAFPGGPMAMMQYLADNINYPDECKKEGIEGRVIITFVVDKDGSIKNPEILQSVYPALDEAAMKVVASMPAWKPGTQNGENVRVRFTLPINFKL